MPYETVRYEVDELILTITLNRPDKLNAFTTQMLHESSTHSTAPTRTTQ